MFAPPPARVRKIYKCHRKYIVEKIYREVSFHEIDNLTIPYKEIMELWEQKAKFDNIWLHLKLVAWPLFIPGAKPLIFWNWTNVHFLCICLLISMKSAIYSFVLITQTKSLSMQCILEKWRFNDLKNKTLWRSNNKTNSGQSIIQANV